MNRLALLATLLLTAPAAATDPPAFDTAVLQTLVRDALLQNLPDPLAHPKHDWGRQVEVTVGYTVRRSGPLRWDAEPRRAVRNDGHWHALRFQAVDPAKTLAVGLSDIAAPEPGRVTFTAKIGADLRFDFQQQLWKAGARLYSGETRGRCRGAVLLKCEATSRTESKPGSLLPDVVARVRVTEAQVFYDDLVIDHTLGVGGDAAKLLGETAHRLLKRFKPSLETDLLAKANAAIVKAADTREARVELDKLLAGKPPAVTRPKK